MHEQQSTTGDITTTTRNLIEHTESHRWCSQLRLLDMLKPLHSGWLCYWGTVSGTPDAMEGMRAFMEKLKPVFNQ